MSQVGDRSVAGLQKLADLRRQKAQKHDCRSRSKKKCGPATVVLTEKAPEAMVPEAKGRPKWSGRLGPQTVGDLGSTKKAREKSWAFTLNCSDSNAD